MSWTDGITREAAWFTTDPAFSGCPTLLKSASPAGPFDIVQGYASRSFSIGRTLYIYRDGGTDAPVEGMVWGERWTEHHFVAKILWALNDVGGSVEADLLALDGAIERVIDRILGPQGDKTHGGRFNLGLQSGINEIAVHVGDPMEAIQSSNPHWATVHWTMWDQRAG